MSYYTIMLAYPGTKHCQVARPNQDSHILLMELDAKEMNKKIKFKI